MEGPRRRKSWTSLNFYVYAATFHTLPLFYLRACAGKNYATGNPPLQCLKTVYIVQSNGRDRANKKSQHFPVSRIFSVRTCVNEIEAIHERPNLRVSTFMTVRVTFHTSSQFYLRGWNLRGTHGKNYALVEIYLNGWLSVNSAFLLAIRACKMGISGPVARSGFRSCLVPHEKILSWPFNKSFIDQACVFKVAEYWARSFFTFLFNC